MTRARDIADGKFANDLTVDTNTLKVDATNNRIGVNVASPTKTLDLNAGAVGNIATFTDGVATNFTFKTNSSNVGTFGTEAGSTHLAFMASGAEKGRFLSGGGLTFNGDTAAANALDDYEEGTFTPSYTSGTSSATYSVQTGRYTKIGDRVFFNFELDGNSITGNTDHLYIGGLPFTSSNTQAAAGAQISYSGGVPNDIHVTGVVFANMTTIGVYKYSNGGAVAGNTMSLNGGWTWAGHYDV